MRLNSKDLATGIIFMGAGGFYLIYALQTLSIGSALNMGPGYFPVLLSSATMLIGAIVAIRSFYIPMLNPFGVVPWRAIVMVTLAVVFFAMFALELGLLLTVFISALLASCARPVHSLPKIGVACLGIAIFCTLVFRVGVGVPIPILGSWIN